MRALRSDDVRYSTDFSLPSSFVLLFILFVVAIEYSERDHINTAEIVFMVYALGFSLEKFAAMQEHGIRGR